MFGRLFKNKKESFWDKIANVPKYCHKCGQRMNVVSLSYEFDENTGERVVLYVGVACDYRTIPDRVHRSWRSKWYYESSCGTAETIDVPQQLSRTLDIDDVRSIVENK
jgi:hypothetical protein